ncbi:unnamed protein product, partial [Polarella glacialis]
DMALLQQAVRAARIRPKSLTPAASACRLFSTPALRAAGVDAQQRTSVGAKVMPTGLGAPLSKRHAGVSVLGCAIAMVAVGGCAQ